MNQALEVDVNTAKQWISDGQAVLVDVRENDEFVAEHVPGAKLNPLSIFDPAAVAREAKDGNQKILLMCRSGKRASDALVRLKNATSAQAYCVSGGIVAWKNAGFETKALANAPISIMRQVQIVAGSLVVVGIILGEAVSPTFRLVSAFVGAGLVFAGATGTCGLAAVLSFMPWNRCVRDCAPQKS